jgi:hypothetical protein
MSTTTATSSAAAPPAATQSKTSAKATMATSALTTSSLATSARFRAFVVAFGISAPVMYVLCVLFNLPLFTFHPATDRFAWGWEAARSGEGPAMYWYGWTATILIVGSVVGMVAAMLPEGVSRKIPLALVWLVPVVGIPIMIYTLMPFWTHP